MRKRSEARSPKEERAAPEFVIENDAGNEQLVLAAAMVDEASRTALIRRIQPDHFFEERHRAAWAAMQELGRRKLGFDLTTLARVGGDQVDVGYLAQLAGIRPNAPENLEWHVGNLEWDRTRIVATQGPVTALLEALRDQQEEPDRVRALARQVAASFDGQAGEHLHAPAELVREQLREIDQRVLGHACWPYGIQGLDRYEDGAVDDRGRDVGGTLRMTPGAKPGQVTVVTATSGSGKSVTAAHMTLGSARQRRKVCYGAWEVSGGMTIELLAVISLGWSRTQMLQGTGPVATREGRVKFEERMHAISKWVVFMRNPFRKRGGKPSNARNLDIVQSMIEDSGAEVFVADLWRRCLVGKESRPEDEEEALFRQQAMAEEMQVHCILLHQQRSKDIEQREDKRPTREGIKGSSAYLEIADTMLAPHRPALWKRIEDNTLEMFVLKQRHGRWPLGVAFDWDGDLGSIGGGTSIEYDRPGEDSNAGDFLAPAFPKRGKRG